MCINVVYGIFMTFITSPSGPVVYETLYAEGYPQPFSPDGTPLAEYVPPEAQEVAALVVAMVTDAAAIDGERIRVPRFGRDSHPAAVQSPRRPTTAVPEDNRVVAAFNVRLSPPGDGRAEVALHVVVPGTAHALMLSRDAGAHSVRMTSKGGDGAMSSLLWRRPAANQAYRLAAGFVGGQDFSLQARERYFIEQARQALGNLTLEAAGVIGTLNDGGLVKAVLVGGILGDWTRPVPLRTTRK